MKLLTRLKDTLEAPERGAATATVRLVDLAIVTYTVPLVRVAPLLPGGLPADALPGADGEPVAFLQTLCSYCEDARWSPAAVGSGESFHQVTHRILTRRPGGKPGAYVLRTDVSTTQAHVASRAIAREADYARFSVYIDGDPVRGNYRSYSLRAVGERGKTELELRPLPIPAEGDSYPVPVPFGRWEDMVDFLTRREEVYVAASTSKKATVLTPVRYNTPLTPAAAEVASARLSLWKDLEALPLDLQTSALTVLLQPSVLLTAYPPRPVRFAPRSSSDTTPDLDEEEDVEEEENEEGGAADSAAPPTEA